MQTFTRIALSLGIIALPILFINCSGGSKDAATITDQDPVVTPTENVIPKGNRVLGVDIVNESPASSFVQNAQLAKSFGADYFILDMTWKQVESVGTSANCNVGTYTDPNGQLALFNSALPALNIKMTLNFSLSTTNIWSMPSAHSSSTFNLDPTLTSTQNDIDKIACRYVNALNYVLTHMPNVNITTLQIGNEIDYLSEAQNYNFWANYWRFFAYVAASARTLRTTSITAALPIGVTASLSGLTGGKGETIRLGLDSLNQTISDFVAANFYPFEAGGSQAKIDTIGPKLNALITAAGTKTVHVQEFGCQSGSVSGSSSELQQKCFEELLKVWDASPTKLTHVNILRMNDLSHSDATSLASGYSFPAAPAADFIDYLETLGLLNYSGSEKSSLTYLKAQLKLRGWY